MSGDKKSVPEPTDNGTWSTRKCILFNKLSQTATIPVRATKHSAGFDLVASNDVTLFPGSFARVPTGVSVQLPPGVYGQIYGRSGNTVNHGIIVGGGVIDNDYAGELVVLATVVGDQPRNIVAGTKIAQLVPHNYCTYDGVEQTFDTDRPGGHVGFGSTDAAPKS